MRGGPQTCGPAVSMGVLVRSPGVLVDAKEFNTCHSRMVASWCSTSHTTDAPELKMSWLNGSPLACQARLSEGDGEQRLKRQLSQLGHDVPDVAKQLFNWAGHGWQFGIRRVETEPLAGRVGIKVESDQ